jgi:hypothetical protein
MREHLRALTVRQIAVRQNDIEVLPRGKNESRLSEGADEQHLLVRQERFRDRTCEDLVIFEEEDAQAKLRTRHDHARFLRSALPKTA